MLAHIGQLDFNSDHVPIVLILNPEEREALRLPDDLDGIYMIPDKIDAQAILRHYPELNLKDLRQLPLGKSSLFKTPPSGHGKNQ